MDFRKFVNSLSDIEKDIFIDILHEDLRNRKENFNTLYETNYATIKKWSNNQCIHNTVEIVSKEFAKSKTMLTESYLNSLTYSDLISFRNLGPKKVKEFLTFVKNKMREDYVDFEVAKMLKVRF